jgi:hypothetical protein
LLGLSRNNWIAVLVFLGGLAGLWWWQRHGPDRVIGTPIDQPGDDTSDDAEHADDDADGAPRAQADGTGGDTAPPTDVGRQTTAHGGLAPHNGSQ